jgi:hypothetical protein
MGAGGVGEWFGDGGLRHAALVGMWLGCCLARRWGVCQGIFSLVGCAGAGMPVDAHVGQRHDIQTPIDGRPMEKRKRVGWHPHVCPGVARRRPRRQVMNVWEAPAPLIFAEHGRAPVSPWRTFSTREHR